VLWVAALSPLGYPRFSVLDTDRSFTVHRAGTYVLFEEFAGATEPDLPSPIDVSIIGEDGRTVPLRYQQDPGERAAVDPYSMLGVEGRAIARFDIDEPGRYLVQVQARRPQSYEPGDYRSGVPLSLAVGRDISTSWLGSPIVGIAAGPGLFVLGILLAVVGWQSRDRAGRASVTTPAEPPGTLR
jgi:hypothetical protein